MTLKEQMPLIRVDKLYESLRYNEYSPENGMGEIVDNSVEAGAARIDLCITRSKQKGKGRPKTRITEIAVADNGCGMDFTTISKCLALGESIRPANRERPGIGRFGVGMTLGSISLARRVEVYSRMNPEEDFLYSYIDLDEVNARKLKTPAGPRSQNTCGRVRRSSARPGRNHRPSEKLRPYRRRSGGIGPLSGTDLPQIY